MNDMNTETKRELVAAIEAYWSADDENRRAIKVKEDATFSADNSTKRLEDARCSLVEKLGTFAIIYNGHIYEKGGNTGVRVRPMVEVYDLM